MNYWRYGRWLLAAWIMLGVCVSSSAQIKVQKMGSLPGRINESSGLVYENENSFWTHNDGGGGTVLYNIDSTGKLVRQVNIPNTKNYDWEEITRDDKGRLYIGDFGNNLNGRKHLVIYRIKFYELIGGKTVDAKKIEFKFEDQKDFPPAPSKRHFDCEAMVVFNDSIFLFTKNRTKPFDGKIKVYAIPNKKGEHKARLINTIQVGGKSMLYWWVTAATIVGKDVYLLSTNKIFILRDFLNNPRKQISPQVRKLTGFSQKEGMASNGKNLLYFTDERFGPTGGHLSKAKIRK